MNGRAIPGAYLFRLYVCDKEMSWPHHIGETHQPDWVVYVRDKNLWEITFRLTNVIPERIIFVSRGITIRLSEVEGGEVRQWDGRKANTTTFVLIDSSFVIGTFFRLLPANFISTFLNQLINCLILVSMKKAYLTANDCSQWHIAHQWTQNALLRLRGNCGCENAPQCYISRTVLFLLCVCVCVCVCVCACISCH
jgi:hypothetical protein